MDQIIHIGNIFNAVLYSLIGLTIFAVGFITIDKLTPYNLWSELVEKHNVALAIVVGSISIGLCMIISSAIH